jgi:hypothetical protein
MANSKAKLKGTEGKASPFSRPIRTPIIINNNTKTIKQLKQHELPIL